MKDDEKDALTKSIMKNGVLKIQNPPFTDALMAKIEMEKIEAYPKINYKPVWLLVIISFLLVPFVIVYSSSFFNYISLLISTLTGFKVSCFAQQIVSMLLFTGLLLAIASNIVMQVFDSKRVEKQALV